MGEKNGFIKLLLGILLLWMVTSLSNCIGGGGDCDAFGNDKYQAWADAKSVVEKRLKSPSTAEFCDFSDAEVTRKGNSWTVEGYVDAQNGFGAFLRSDFTVKITYTSDTGGSVDYCHIN